MKRRKPRPWTKMTEDDLRKYAVENGFAGKSASYVQDHDYMFYDAVRKCGLTGTIFSLRRRNFSLSDDDLIAYARERGFVGRRPVDVENEDPSFYAVLRKRNLAHMVFRPERRRWSRMTDEQFTAYAQAKGYIGKRPSDVEAEDGSFYSEARKRGLGDRIFSEGRKPRGFATLSDREILEYAQRHGHVGKSPTDLRKDDNTFFKEIKKRGLEDKILARSRRSWNGLTNEEVVDLAKKLGHYGKRPVEVQKSDPAFYAGVHARALDEKVFDVQIRHWKKMSNDEVVHYAKDHGYMGKSPYEMEKEDTGFYYCLLKRGLASRVLRYRKTSARDTIVEVLEAFGNQEI